MVDCSKSEWKFTVHVRTELGQLSGVASILRFPLPEPEDSDASDQDDDN